MRIDAHHHFWKYNPAEYGWIDDAMKSIRRDFLPADLDAATASAGVDGVISVQARQCLEETAWLLDLAAQNRWIRGVVGWLPLCSDTIADDLDRWASHSKLRAVRHVIQAEPDGFLAREDFNRGVALLAGHNLAYDLLIVERQLPATIPFVDRHPNQVFILDHIAKPQIKRSLLQPWAKNIVELAKRPNVYCKVSGMVTEADFARWTPESLRPYFDRVLEAFGPQRLMFGSDWPVCLVACGYSRWVRTVGAFAEGLSHAEQHALFGLTAAKAYRLEIAQQAPKAVLP